MDESALSPAETRSGSAATLRPAVLLVDDNQANLTAMEAVLGSLDLELAKAESGDEALKHLLARDFAVVLMDVQMPGLDGFQTTELIRQRDRTRHVPIIFVTAIHTDKESVHKAYALGALDYVTKPFDEAVLKAKVAAIVDHYRQADIIALQAEALRAKEHEADREVAARRVAEQANRAKDDFLAMISHELRAPLNAILGWASVLERDAELPPRAALAAQAIARSARAQSKLIDDLLDLSSMAAEKFAITPGRVDLATITQSALAAMQTAAMHKRVQLELSVGPGSYRTRGDGARLEQLVGNLLSNAVKFSNDGDPVQIELVRHDQTLRLCVKDVGIGISAELLPHVFERFRQADGSRTRQYGGLGIGLTLARLVAESHGGTLEAFSSGEGKGASFVVTLPIVDADADADADAGDADGYPAGARAATATASFAAQPLAGLRLLIVDDDADVRSLLTLTLADAGAEVRAAESAQDALRLFEQGSFDLFLSDLGMPGEDGLSLIEKIRAVEARRGGAVVAIAFSGYGSASDREQTRRAGFQAHVVKPCEPVELVALMARLSGRG